jgi:hypothetical protein
MLERFFSYNQLAKSWQQLRNGQNHRYKYYFKHIYQGYEIALEENLKNLSARLISGGFSSPQVLRIFMPKSNTSQRPITLMPIEDQIAYQAIACLVADNIVSKRRKTEFQTVFSNILAEDRSTFLFEDWRFCYEKYQEQTESLVKSGYDWVVTCDLASFYDTISHDILFNQISILKNKSDEKEFLSNILSSWTFEKKYEARKHGLPQGPISSDLLAEVFLMVLDETLLNEIKYIRYVDDIRIFAKSREEAQSAALKLERTLRGMGLVPQPEKFSIQQLKDGTELHKMEASETYDFVEDPDENIPLLDKDETERVLFEAMEDEDIITRKGLNPTLTKFSLFRGIPNSKTKKHVLRITEYYPQFVEAGFVFLQRSQDRTDAIFLAEKLLSESPFGYVKYKCWDFLTRCYSDLSGFKRSKYASIAVDTLKSQKKEEPANLLGASRYLLYHSEKKSTRQSLFIFRLKNRFIIALSLKFLGSKIMGLGQVEYRRLHSELPDIGLAALHQFDSYGANLSSSLNPRKRRATPYTAGLSKLTNQVNGVSDAVSAGIHDHFNIIVPDDLKPILGRKWQQALRYITRANVYKKSAAGTWLRSVNGICELFAWALARRHNSKAKKSDKAELYQNGSRKFLKYGQLIDDGRKLSRTYPNIFDEFKTVNKRRNEDSDSHALNEKTGRRPKPSIKANEVNKILRVAAKGIKKVCDKIQEI